MGVKSLVKLVQVALTVLIVYPAKQAVRLDVLIIEFLVIQQIVVLDVKQYVKLVQDVIVIAIPAVLVVMAVLLGVQVDAKQVVKQVVQLLVKCVQVILAIIVILVITVRIIMVVVDMSRVALV